jgi:colanic acid biosynthesis glycosyl transferase WcaI
MTKRILFLTPYLAPETGAAPVRVSATAAAFAELGWDVRVVTGMPNYPEGVVHSGYRGKWIAHETLANGARVLRLRTIAGGGKSAKRYANFLSTAIVCVAPIFSRWRPDAVVAEVPPPTQFLPAWLVARRFGAVLVSSIADLWPETAIRLGLLPAKHPVTRVAAALEAQVYRRSDVLVAITAGIGEHLTRVSPDTTVVVARNGVDTALFAPGSVPTGMLEGFGIAGAYVLYAGSLGVPTAPLVLVTAAEGLVGSGVTIVVAGSGSEASTIRDAAERLESLVYLGSVPVPVVADLYRGAFAGVVTLAKNDFFSGTLPAKTLPILGSGIPVVYSGDGEGAKLVAEVGAGVITPPEDAVALTQAILELHRNAELAAQCGRQGREYAETHLSWRAVAEQIGRALAT